MNRIPRPDDALAVRLRGLSSSVKSALAGLSSLRAQVRALEARVAELERQDEREVG